MSVSVCLQQASCKAGFFMLHSSGGVLFSHYYIGLWNLVGTAILMKLSVCAWKEDATMCRSLSVSLATHEWADLEQYYLEL